MPCPYNIRNTGNINMINIISKKIEQIEELVDDGFGIDEVIEVVENDRNQEKEKKRL